MEETIINYTKAINVLTLERYNTDKMYLDLIASWGENEIKLADNSIDKLQVLFREFILVLNDLAEKTFELFSAAIRIMEGNKKALNTFNNRLSHVKSSLEAIRLFSDVIIVNVQKQQISEAKFLQATLLNLIDKTYSLLTIMGINLIVSPVYKEFKEAEKAIKKVRIIEVEKKHLLRVIKEKTPLNAFFKSEVSQEKITAIQTDFRHLKNKKMAVLIYLLQKKYELISIDNPSKEKSRLNFVRAFTGEERKEISGINRFFNYDEDLKLENKDKVLETIGNQLEKIVSSC